MTGLTQSIWGYQMGDLVSTDQGEGRVERVVPEGSTLTPGLGVQIESFAGPTMSVVHFVYRLADVERAREGSR